MQSLIVAWNLVVLQLKKILGLGNKPTKKEVTGPEKVEVTQGTCADCAFSTDKGAKGLRCIAPNNHGWIEADFTCKDFA